MELRTVFVIVLVVAFVLVSVIVMTKVKNTEVPKPELPQNPRYFCYMLNGTTISSQDFYLLVYVVGVKYCNNVTVKLGEEISVKELVNFLEKNTGFEMNVINMTSCIKPKVRVRNTLYVSCDFEKDSLVLVQSREIMEVFLCC